MGSGMITTVKDLGELPRSYNILSHVEIPDESVLPIKTKKIQVIPSEHETIIKQIAMEYSPNKNERYLYRYEPAIVFLLNTGMRGGELLALGRKSIIPYQGRRGVNITQTLSRVKDKSKSTEQTTKLILTPPKYSKSVRIIPLNREVEFSLSCMLELYGRNYFDEDLILSLQNGKVPNIQSLEKTLKKICQRAGLPEYRLHSLRHTFAANMIRQTKNMAEVKEVAEILGDGYEVVLKTYLHAEDEKKINLVDALIA